jgi:hypothetical protein
MDFHNHADAGCNECRKNFISACASDSARIFLVYHVQRLALISSQIPSHRNRHLDPQPGLGQSFGKPFSFSGSISGEKCLVINHLS